MENTQTTMTSSKQPLSSKEKKEKEDLEKIF